MKTLYIECAMGCAGDMLTAALFELLSEEQKTAFLEKMNGLGLPGVHVAAEPADLRHRRHPHGGDRPRP